MMFTCLLVVLTLIVPVFVYAPFLPDTDHTQRIEYVVPAPVSVQSETVSQPLSLIVVGDIMVGRRVETMMKTQGHDFPFASTTELLKSADLAVGNLEGVVPNKHIHTPDLTFRFSFSETALEAVRRAGFDVLSLANNHAYDYGLSGYQDTLVMCEQYELLCFGSPTGLSSSSVQFIMIGETKVALLMINATYGYPSWSDVEPHMHFINEDEVYTLAYVHWGEEYALRNNQAQEDFAQALIAAGADAVIGHHPHVVQNVSLYQGKPIFYSLGNFIFDQYFNDQVQIGLAVKIQIDAEVITYELIPLSALERRSQPQRASASAEQELWDRIMVDLIAHPAIDSHTKRILVPRTPGR